MFSEDKSIEMFDDSMVDFLYAKDAKHKWKTLDIVETERCCWHDYRIDLEMDNTFDLIEREFNIPKIVCLCDNLNYHYHFSDGAGPLLIKIEYFEATIMNRIVYNESNSLGITQALWRINYELTAKISERNNQPAYLVNNMLTHINAGRLPTNKITYFKDLVVCYNNVEKVNYRGKEKYHINARVISGQILLPEENQYMSESE